MDPNWSISFVRTVVAPLLIGCLGQWALFAFSDASLTLRAAMAALIGAVWYVFARCLQVRHPQLGFLLLVSARPRYERDPDVELLVSVVRTVVPLAVAIVVGYLVTAVGSGSTPAICLIAVAVTYYGVLRLVEERTHPESTVRNVAGWMLGAPLAPRY